MGMHFDGTSWSGPIYASHDMGYDRFELGYRMAASMIARSSEEEAVRFRNLQAKRDDGVPHNLIAGMDTAIADSRELEEIFREIEDEGGGDDCKEDRGATSSDS